MSETTNQFTQGAEEQQQPVEQKQEAQLPNPFLESSWSSPGELTGQGSNTSQYSSDEDDEEIIEPDEWLKREFSWENTEQAKAELEELRQLRERQEEQEIEFENEESLNLFRLFKEGKQDDVYNYLENRRKLDKLLSSEVNKDTAADIVKLSLQNTYKDLTPEEIEYKFNREFGVPPKPVQQDIETDEEYQERLSSWESKVKDIETDLMIEAKLSRPELEKMKSELVFPDIDDGRAPSQLSQEELEVQAQYIDQFKEIAAEQLLGFEGFSVSVKDEEVEIPLSYAISEEEKQYVAEQLDKFADANFDANVILAERWLDDKGNIDTSRVVKDLALLLSEGKMSQKFVNEAASKRLAEHIRRTSNISLSSRAPQQTFNPESKSELDKQIEYIWKNS